jgi:hypothetical protein
LPVLPSPSHTTPFGPTASCAAGAASGTSASVPSPPTAPSIVAASVAASSRAGSFGAAAGAATGLTSLVTSNPGGAASGPCEQVFLSAVSYPPTQGVPFLAAFSPE